MFSITRAVESFPEAPPLDEDSSTFTFPEAPKDDPLTTIITNSTKSHENVDVDALEQRLKKLHPNTSFTSKPTVLPLSSKPETAEDLLKRYTEEANVSEYCFFPVCLQTPCLFLRKI